MPAAPRLLKLLPLIALAGVSGAVAQPQAGLETIEETRRALAEAEAQGLAAQRRAESLEAGAAQAREAADRTAQEAAALAARIQQAEAAITGAEVRITMIDRQRAALRERLAQRERPLVQLTAALQRLSRRPAVLSLFRPGTLQDTVHLRAALDGMLPEVGRRTAALRSEIARSRTLQQQAEQAVAGLRGSEQKLNERRRALAALETRQRLDLRAVSGSADREAERALALAEQARDLSGLIGSLGESAALREKLAGLPGPVLRPERPDLAEVTVEPIASPSATALGRYILPVAGRLVAGFGDTGADGVRSRGISLAPRPTAQVIAPAAGRVAFAGLYEGFGNIVIIDHGGGWTTLVTGLVRLDAQVGERLVEGSPLGLTGPGRPVVTIELRRGGEPVNPLDIIRSA